MSMSDFDSPNMRWGAKIEIVTRRCIYWYMRSVHRADGLSNAEQEDLRTQVKCRTRSDIHQVTSQVDIIAWKH
jgi:hypothetical protein